MNAPALPPPDSAPDPAAALLLACARADLGFAGPGELDAAAAGVTDWERVRALTCRHGLTPLLHLWLAAEGGPPIPAEFRGWLVERFHAHTLRALAFTHELLRLRERFAAAGLEVIAFKGPVLAQLLHGHATRREFSDLDLLVRPGDAAAAAGLLRREGYRPHYELTAAQFDRYRAIDCELAHVHRELALTVDLHWGLAPAPYRDVFHAEEIWRGHHTVTLAGRPVRTLPPEILVPFLILHHSKHNWAWLVWLHEIVRLLRDCDAAAWDRLLADAARRRLGRMVRLGACLGHRLYGLPLPPDLAASLTGDPRLAALAAAALAELWHETDRPPRFPLFRAAMDSPADVRRYWCANILTPRPEDWRLVALPRPLHGLYRPLRLLRLVAKRLPFARPGA